MKTGVPKQRRVIIATNTFVLSIPIKIYRFISDSFNRILSAKRSLKININWIESCPDLESKHRRQKSKDDFHRLRPAQKSKLERKSAHKTTKSAFRNLLFKEQIATSLAFSLRLRISMDVFWDFESIMSSNFEIISEFLQLSFISEASLSSQGLKVRFAKNIHDIILYRQVFNMFRNPNGDLQRSFVLYIYQDASILVRILLSLKSQGTKQHPRRHTVTPRDRTSQETKLPMET